MFSRFSRYQEGCRDSRSKGAQRWPFHDILWLEQMLVNMNQIGKNYVCMVFRWDPIQQRRQDDGKRGYVYFAFAVKGVELSTTKILNSQNV